MHPSHRRVAFVAVSAAASVALAFATAAHAGSIVFNDATTAAGLDHQTETFGASWGDLNGDGFPDLFVSYHRTPDSLYLNRGNGTFYDTRSQVKTWVYHKNGDNHGGTFADFDNDGDQDLLVSTGTGNLIQFLVNEHDALVDGTVQYGVNNPSVGGRMPIWLDFNRDHRLDIVLTQYGKMSRVLRQLPDGSGFKDVTVPSGINCFNYHYAQLIDINDDGTLDLLCADQTLFPQKIYNTRTWPWTTLFDSSAPNGNFRIVASTADSIIADFNNDGRMDMFILGGTQLRPSSVVQGGSNRIEAQLAGGVKGFNFTSGGSVTFNMDWNKADEGTKVDLAKIHIGKNGWHPTAIPFTLNPGDAKNSGTPAPPSVQADLPAMDISYDPATQHWTLVLWTTLGDPLAQKIFSEAYLQLTTTAAITGLKSTGLWGTDKPARPTLLLNYPGGFVDATAASGLGAAVQCTSVTAGDFDNDENVDLFMTCGTGASNTADILYQNAGGANFVAVPNAGGAAGPIGIAVGDNAGTPDSVVSADYDVDGFLDLFETNGGNLRPIYFGGPVKLYRNAGNGNHWIELNLVGTRSDRDATGARVYATTADGTRQLRVQNGAYHRWSQDMKRSHFGLAGNTTVNLRVEWPSGSIDTFNNVAADRLYRVTEKVAPATVGTITPVALGVAPAYPCGAPTLNAGSDVGVFVWKDCTTGAWLLKALAGGGSMVFSGTVTSGAAYGGVAKQGLGGSDTLNNSNPKQIAFTIHAGGSAVRGFKFTPQSGATNCLNVSAGATKVYYGPFRKALTDPLDLETQKQPCP